MKQIDILAAKRGLQDADDYLAQWKWSEEEEREGSAREVAEAVKAELEAKGLSRRPSTQWPSRSPSTDNRSKQRAGVSLFEQAEALGIDVPTSCRKQGKCKECMVEVVEGMELLSPLDGAGAAPEGQFPALLPDVCDGRERACALPYHAARADAHRAACAGAAGSDATV